ncbi:MAG: envelope stress response membrane protein PspB [Sphingomonadales bacterium]|nr:envelope stress response membrane protein PspB [Sphingomonadales bacterium]
MEDFFVVTMVMGTLFIGLPWVIMHYVTKWKSAATMTSEDENLLDELYDTARRLEDRLHTVERIIAADRPDWQRPVRADVDAAVSKSAERSN